MLHRVWFRKLGLLLLAVTFGYVAPVNAQSRGTALLPPNVARQYGMERVWNSQIQVGGNRSRVVSVTPYVSGSRSTTEFEVTAGSTRWIFAEGARDKVGRPMDAAAAERQATRQIDRFKAQNPNADEPKLEKHVVPEITLYCTTDRGVVHAIDGETGATRWVANLGHPNYPMSAAAASDTHVTFISGSSLYVLSAENGELKWKRAMSGVPGASPAISHEYVFAPMTNGSIESYTIADSKEHPWIYRGVGRAMVAPTYGLNTLVWPTDRGHLYVANAGNRGIRYRLEATDLISSSVTFWPPDQFFAASADGYVYSLHPTRTSGNITWRYSSGESISRSPIPANEAVYAITDDTTLVSLDIKTGKLRWKVQGIKGYLGSSKTRVYVVGEVGRVVVLDIESGDRVAVIPLDEFDLQVANPLTDRIYIGTKMGSIQCIREIGANWPTVHLTPPDQSKPKPRVIQQGLPGTGGGAAKPEPGEDPFSSKAKPADNEDPFGGGGGAKPAPKNGAADDPFGAPAGKPAPKPKDDSDPFGS